MDLTNKNFQSPPHSPHDDLLATINLVYDPCKFKYSQPIKEPEGSEYGAHVFELNSFSIRFRVAKITPTKIGQFVTLWKRSGSGPIQPFDFADSVDFFVISTPQGVHFGQFVFPKSVLCERGILSLNGKGGKRAIRVYPPWVMTLNRQAQKTQEWQVSHFLEISEGKEMDKAKAHNLYRQQ